MWETKTLEKLFISQFSHTVSYLTLEDIKVSHFHFVCWEWFEVFIFIHNSKTYSTYEKRVVNCISFSFRKKIHLNFHVYANWNVYSFENKFQHFVTWYWKVNILILSIIKGFSVEKKVIWVFVKKEKPSRIVTI